MATKNLLESYKKRLSLAESLYSKSHNGEPMDTTRRLATAKCLDNINRFMNESFTTAQATQRADMGTWKRFCLC